eukprot:g2836.t1
MPKKRRPAKQEHQQAPPPVQQQQHQGRSGKSAKPSRGGYDAFADLTKLLRSGEPPAPTHETLYRDLIFGVSSLLSPDECAASIAAAERRGFTRVTQAQSRTHAHRDNDRLMVDDQPDLAAALYERVRAFVPADIDGRKPVGVNSRIRFYRYNVGQRFGEHVDESDEDPPGSGIWSEHTLLVYLNGGGDGDELRGGETVFFKGSGKKMKEVLSVAPKQGACLLHGHGHRCLLHAGAEVTRGVKYLLRTDVMYQ